MYLALYHSQYRWLRGCAFVWSLWTVRNKTGTWKLTQKWTERCRHVHFTFELVVRELHVVRHSRLQNNGCQFPSSRVIGSNSYGPAPSIALMHWARNGKTTVYLLRISLFVRYLSNKHCPSFVSRGEVVDFWIQLLLLLPTVGVGYKLGWFIYVYSS